MSKGFHQESMSRERKDYSTWEPEEMQLLHKSIGGGVQGPHISPLTHSPETLQVQLGLNGCFVLDIEGGGRGWRDV